MNMLPDQFGQTAIEDLKIVRDGLPDVYRPSVQYGHRIEAARRAYTALSADVDRASWVINELDTIRDSAMRGREPQFNPFPIASWFVPGQLPEGIAALQADYDRMSLRSFLSVVQIEQDRYSQARDELVSLAGAVRDERIRLSDELESWEQSRQDEIEQQRIAGNVAFIAALASQVKQQIESESTR